MRSFKEKTGCPVLINTSFNIRGEPIVCSPDDALRCFWGTEMDVLVLENFVICREAQKNAPVIDREIECLALTIYFEARGELDAGKVAVGHVVMNRVVSPRYPRQICAVVRQGGEWPKYRCQFSWWCDGRSDNPKDIAAWNDSMTVARNIFWGLAGDPTAGALHYHATYVAPYWSKLLGAGETIGAHIFYAHGDSAEVQSAQLKP